MNIQEKFKQFLKEEPHDTGQPYGFARVGAPGGVLSVDDVVDSAPFTLSPENIEKLNGYLSAASMTPVLNPYFLLNRIQTKLAQIGLQFDIPKFIGDTGTVSKPVTQFGGSYGYEKPLGDKFKHSETKDITYPKIGNGDGITDRIPGGLDIKIHWTCYKGLYTISAELVPGSKPKPEKIQETDVKKKITESSPTTIKGSTKFPTGPIPPGPMPTNESEETVCEACGKVHMDEECPLAEVSPPGWSGTTKAMKKHKEITNPFSLSCYLKKKGAHPHYEPEKKTEEIEVDEAKEKSLRAKNVNIGSNSAARNDMSRHRGIKNPFSLIWYLKKHGKHFSGR